MRHPNDGTLRRLVDEPSGVADADREHVASCPGCLAGVAAAQEDAALTGAALDVPTHVDVDTGWERLSLAAGTGAGDRQPTNGQAARRWQSRLRSPVVAGIGVLVLRHSGLSYAEVAAALDLSPGSVGTTVRRAESALREELIRHASSD